MEFLWFACARLGAVVVTTNTRSAGAELEYFADHCNAVAAITQPELAETVAAQRQAHQVAGGDRASGRRRRAAGQPATRASQNASPASTAIRPTCRSWSPIRGGRARCSTPPAPRRGPRACCGRTATRCGARARPPIHENLNENDIHLVSMPSFHTNARTYSILPTMWVGGTVVLKPRFSASRFWDIALQQQLHLGVDDAVLPQGAGAAAGAQAPFPHVRHVGQRAGRSTSCSACARSAGGA